MNCVPILRQSKEGIAQIIFNNGASTVIRSAKSLRKITRSNKKTGANGSRFLFDIALEEDAFGLLFDLLRGDEWNTSGVAFFGSHVFLGP